MTLYARSDVQAVAVSPDLGCGDKHVRPNRKDGTPVRVWGLDCPPCETQLEDDAQWSKSRYNIPLTDEEQADLDDLNKRAESIAARERIESGKELARAVAERQQADEAGADDPDDKPVLPEASCDNEEPHEPHDFMPNPNTHARCPGRDAEDDAGGQSDNLDDLARKDLNARARDAGLDFKGTRDEVIARLRKHSAEAGEQE